MCHWEIFDALRIWPSTATRKGPVSISDKTSYLIVRFRGHEIGSLNLLYRFEIWQAHRQQWCRCACQISERSDNWLRDLTIRCWNRILKQDPTWTNMFHGTCGWWTTLTNNAFRVFTLCKLLDKSSRIFIFAHAKSSRSQTFGSLHKCWHIVIQQVLNKLSDL